MSTDYFLGIDFGTSGVRAIAIDREKRIQATARCDYTQSPSSTEPSENQARKDPLSDMWRQALMEVISHIPLVIRRHLRAIAINGTSGTVLWCDAQGHPVTSPILYNDDRGKSVLGLLRAIAPPNHVVLSATSSLSKLLWWSSQALELTPDNNDLENLSALTEAGDRLPSGYFLHQADWIAFLLHGKLGISDYHNSLKLGYDVEHLTYPNWMQPLPTGWTLPTVVAPGTPIAPVQSTWGSQFDLPADCYVCAGTTDSIAAFLASGVDASGEAVTSLGSTLVIKLLSRERVNDARYGIYSHRLDGWSRHGSQSRHAHEIEDRNITNRPPTSSVHWLVGGASNTGGAVLRQFFSDHELQTLGDRIDLDQESPLDYYPLSKPGERFPINDPQLMPRLSPRPKDDVQFLHGLLEGIATIEAQGFQLLSELGATPLSAVYTAGGGAKNAAWTVIRQRRLGVPVMVSPNTEAAYGTACLALRGMAKNICRQDAR
ncbi:MAG: FGGY-family carbohydrate kinase [Cyanobacteria bacterium P01_E01_bin.6]